MQLDSVNLNVMQRLVKSDHCHNTIRDPAELAVTHINMQAVNEMIK